MTTLDELDAQAIDMPLDTADNGQEEVGYHAVIGKSVGTRKMIERAETVERKGAGKERRQISPYILAIVPRHGGYKVRRAHAMDNCDFRLSLLLLALLLRS